MGNYKRREGYTKEKMEVAELRKRTERRDDMNFHGSFPSG